MTNDAKLGLLVGVAGVILAAAVSGNRPSIPAGTPAAEAPQSPASGAKAEVAIAPEPRPVAEKEFSRAAAAEVVVAPAPAEFPRELPSTPVVRTRREPDATPTGRGGSSR